MPSIRLLDKNIIITGASSGIGKACAIVCAEAGARVHLIGRSRRSLDETMHLLSGSGHSISVYDLLKSDGIADLISSLVTSNKQISGFIHSAGIQITKPNRAMSNEDYQWIFQTNTISAFEIVKGLSKSKSLNPVGSSVILISSIMSIVANPGLTGYCASKAALVGGARVLALELASKRVRVNCVSPGFIDDTNMMKALSYDLSEDELNELKKGYPLGLGSANDVASLCLFLLSDDSRWITGQNIVIDGGYTIK